MNRKLCAPADTAQSWESIDWKKAEAYVISTTTNKLCSISKNISGTI